jgi:hypothetical protein
MSRRKKKGTARRSTQQLREEAFMSSDGHADMLSPEIGLTAQLVLKMSLKDRLSDGVLRMKHNHVSWHAAGGIVLLVTTLDASMNEVISFRHGFEHGRAEADRAERRRVACMSLVPKFRELTKHNKQSDRHSLLEDLRALTELRNEIVHFLPRKTVPKWLQRLHDQDLFIATGRNASDLAFSQKLSSYSALYWGWEVGERVLQAVMHSMPPSVQGVCEAVLLNYVEYKDVTPPQQLPDFDKYHGLQLTPPQSE